MYQPLKNRARHAAPLALLIALFMVAACAGQTPAAPTVAVLPTRLAPTVAPQPTNELPTLAPTRSPQATAAPSTAEPTIVPTLAATAATAATAASDAPTTSSASAAITLPAPDCSGGATPPQTEGPYYKANTPERASLLEPGMPGVKMILTGYVLNRDCKPVPGAWLDFWQADAAGQYDNQGYTLRGHQTADANGRYTLETVIPGLYPGRTEHIHVKVRAPNQPIVTTQLYFPEASQSNDRDGIFDQRLLITWLDSPGAKVAYYSFVLPIN